MPVEREQALQVMETIEQTGLTVCSVVPSEEVAVAEGTNVTTCQVEQGSENPWSLEHTRVSIVGAETGGNTYEVVATHDSGLFSHGVNDEGFVGLETSKGNRTGVSVSSLVCAC